jgi:tRNA(adenine34) deaminase
MQSAGMEGNHEIYMQMALEQARLAAAAGEVPVGAVFVDGRNQVTAAGYNQTITENDPTAHAEVVVLRMAARQACNYRLLSGTLYVTIEPCVMCMGALIHARVGRIVFGAPDPKWGAVGSLYDFSTDLRFNHQPEVIGGVCEVECRDIIQSFFREKRQAK